MWSLWQGNGQYNGKMVVDTGAQLQAEANRSIPFRHALIGVIVLVTVELELELENCILQ